MRKVMKLKFCKMAQIHYYKPSPLLIIESFTPKQKTVLSILQNLGYKSVDADRHNPLNLKPNNLFAGYPKGILKETFNQKLIH